MNRDKQEIARIMKILRHAEAICEVARTCRYFGIGRASFYRRLTAYRTGGEADLVNGRPIPTKPPNRAPLEIGEKVLPADRHTQRLPVWMAALFVALENIRRLAPAGAIRLNIGQIASLSNALEDPGKGQADAEFRELEGRKRGAAEGDRGGEDDFVHVVLLYDCEDDIGWHSGPWRGA